MMADSIMYQEDAYVVLESGQPEQVILTAEELLTKLEEVLATLDHVPRDLQRFAPRSAQAKHLMETSCEIDLGPGDYLQWYVVRLEK
nr:MULTISPECIES: chlororespiratory reduction protein 7 [Spirulina]